jgi:hypothetical protein
VFNTLVLHPLYPDKACGLRPFGSYAVQTTYPWVLGGIVGGFLEYLSFRYGEASMKPSQNPDVPIWWFDKLTTNGEGSS